MLFRSLIDSYVMENGFSATSKEELSQEMKHDLLTVLEQTIVVNGMGYKVPNAIRIYVQKTIQVLDDNSFEHLPILSYV